MRNFTGHSGGPCPPKPSKNSGFGGPMPTGGGRNNRSGGPTIIGIPPGTGLEITIDSKGNSHMKPIKP